MSAAGEFARLEVIDASGTCVAMCTRDATRVVDARAAVRVCDVHACSAHRPTRDAAVWARACVHLATAPVRTVRSHTDGCVTVCEMMCGAVALHASAMVGDGELLGVTIMVENITLVSLYRCDDEFVECVRTVPVDAVRAMLSACTVPAAWWLAQDYDTSRR